MADLTDNDRLVAATLVAGQISGQQVPTGVALDLYEEMLREISDRRATADLRKKQFGAGAGTGR